MKKMGTDLEQTTEKNPLYSPSRPKMLKSEEEGQMKVQHTEASSSE